MFFPFFYFDGLRGGEAYSCGIVDVDAVIPLVNIAELVNPSDSCCGSKARYGVRGVVVLVELDVLAWIAQHDGLSVVGDGDNDDVFRGPLRC